MREYIEGWRVICEYMVSRFWYAMYTPSIVHASIVWFAHDTGVYMNWTWPIEQNDKSYAPISYSLVARSQYFWIFVLNTFDKHSKNWKSQVPNSISIQEYKELSDWLKGKEYGFTPLIFEKSVEDMRKKCREGKK